MPVSLVHGCWVFTAGDWRLRPGWLPERVEVKKKRGMYVRVYVGACYHKGCAALCLTVSSQRARAKRSIGEM